jgi:hypothetical protein
MPTTSTTRRARNCWRHPGPLIVPTLVITEVVYLRASRLGPQAELRFLGDVASGVFDVEPTSLPDTLTFHSAQSMPR